MPLHFVMFTHFPGHQVHLPVGARMFAGLGLGHLVWMVQSHERLDQIGRKVRKVPCKVGQNTS